MIDVDPVSESLASRAGALFGAFRAGDEARMAELVTLLTPIMWHTARAQRLDRELAEDVVQSAWLALVRSADGIADPQAVLQWLLVTVKRESWRVLKRDARVEPQEFEPDDVATTERDLPEEQVLRDDGASRLWQHVAQLSDRCRELLRVIAFAERPDYASVAESLGMPVGSIGPTRGRCLAKLRQLLADDPAWEM